MHVLEIVILQGLSSIPVLNQDFGGRSPRRLELRNVRTVLIANMMWMSEENGLQSTYTSTQLPPEQIDALLATGIGRKKTEESLDHIVMSVNQSVRPRLIGAWELISYVVHSEKSASNALYPLGKNAKGIIMYTPDGYMSAQLQCPGQGNFAGAHPIDGSESELAESARKFVGYTGPFYLDDSGPEPILLHHFVVSSFPNWLGDTQERIAKFEGDHLILTTRSPVELKVRYPSLISSNPAINMRQGERWNPILTWRRMANNQASRPPDA
jgi:hypothetical protein